MLYQILWIGIIKQCIDLIHPVFRHFVTLCLPGGWSSSQTSRFKNITILKSNLKNKYCLHTIFILFTQYYNRDYKRSLEKRKIKNEHQFSFYIFCKYYCMMLFIDKKYHIYWNCGKLSDRWKYYISYQWSGEKISHLLRLDLQYWLLECDNILLYPNAINEIITMVWMIHENEVIVLEVLSSTDDRSSSTTSSMW